MEIQILDGENFFQDRLKIIELSKRHKFFPDQINGYLQKPVFFENDPFQTKYNFQHHAPNVCFTLFEVDKATNTKTDRIVGFLIGILTQDITSSCLHKDCPEYSVLQPNEVLLFIHFILLDDQKRNIGGTFLQKIIDFIKNETKRNVRIILEPSESATPYWSKVQQFSQIAVSEYMTKLFPVNSGSWFWMETDDAQYFEFAYRSHQTLLLSNKDEY